MSELIYREQYAQTLKKVLGELKELSEHSFIAYGSHGRALITERLHTALHHFAASGTPLEKMMKLQILEAARKAESEGPNSTDMFVEFFLDLAGEAVESKSPPHKIKVELDEKYKSMQETLQKKSDEKKLTWTEVQDCIRDASRNTRISDMVLQAIELAGLEGKIFSSHSPTGEYSVELVSGYNFPVTTYSIFRNRGKWERKEVAVLVVDGVVERESEVYKLFTQCLENRRPLLLVARGFGEEVIGTIAANKNLDVCPIRIPFELDSLNTITDVGVVCGCTIVSALKGDMVSMVKFEQLPVVDSVVCTEKNLNITNPASAAVAVAHINDLTKRRDGQPQDITDILNKRIQTLVSLTVHIRLGSKTEQEKVQELEAVDYGLRIVKGALEGGVMDPTEVGLKTNGKRPIKSVLSAFHYSVSLVKTLALAHVAVMS